MMLISVTRRSASLTVLMPSHLKAVLEASVDSHSVVNVFLLELSMGGESLQELNFEMSADIVSEAHHFLKPNRLVTLSFLANAIYTL